MHEGPVKKDANKQSMYLEKMHRGERGREREREKEREDIHQTLTTCRQKTKKRQKKNTAYHLSTFSGLHQPVKVLDTS